ncbi:trypsin-3-like [Helicoverpa zea]|uniref:trypsin-3-like n=1 Tax=Helicoverpa zea TaxID=7113 RepID=UPI001F5ACC95|nr:trypsin-3-like [Helicoverpa zea]
MLLGQCYKKMHKRIVVDTQGSPHCNHLLQPVTLMKKFISISIFLLLFLPKYRTESALRTEKGKAVEGNQYPYIVKIEGILDASPKSATNAIHICSAIVVSSTWTITAAHCVARIYSMNHEQPASAQRSPVVRLRRADPPPDAPPSASDIVNIQEGYKHPGYRDFSVGGTLDLRNDVGMLRTDPIALKEYAKISSADFTSMIGVQARTFGYPKSSGREHAVTPARLHSSEVIIVECSSGNEMYPALCAATPCGGRAAACAGDAGAPLLAAPGVVAITGRCGASARGTFVPLSPYLTWISSFILYVH